MSQPLTRLEELLADQATQGLTADEQRELDTLLAEHANTATDPTDFEAAAGALVAATADAPAMPAALRQRILDDAPTHLPAQADHADQTDDEPQTITAPARPNAGVSPVLAFIGGALAAAAVFLIMTRVGTGPGTLTPEELGAQASTIEPAWSVYHEGYEEVTGRVVWNNDQQAGYMILTGLPANDPTQQQYQLWIVDPNRDAAPVDGGVFDIPPAAAGEVLIPIDPKLEILNPAAFAITLEQPGGVVKSAGPLLVTAVVETQG